MILVGCEESGTVTKAFRDSGQKAFSCDLQPTRGNPEWHYQSDIMDVLPMHRWDLVILHPDCTCLAVSGNRWYGRGTPGHQKRLDAIEWTLNLWGLAQQHSGRVCLENPVSVIFQHLPDASVQYIQPWMFGHGETKKTGLALHNLPPLKPTDIVAERHNRVHWMPERKSRKRDRSVTYSGIAQAMAEQWRQTCEH